MSIRDSTSPVLIFIAVAGYLVASFAIIPIILLESLVFAAVAGLAVVIAIGCSIAVAVRGKGKSPYELARSGHCPECGYALHATPDATACPECGFRVTGQMRIWLGGRVDRPNTALPAHPPHELLPVARDDGFGYVALTDPLPDPAPPPPPMPESTPGPWDENYDDNNVYADRRDPPPPA